MVSHSVLPKRPHTWHRFTGNLKGRRRSALHANKAYAMHGYDRSNNFLRCEEVLVATFIGQEILQPSEREFSFCKPIAN